MRSDYVCLSNVINATETAVHAFVGLRMTARAGRRPLVRALCCAPRWVCSVSLLFVAMSVIRQLQSDVCLAEEAELRRLEAGSADVRSNAHMVRSSVSSVEPLQQMGALEVRTAVRVAQSCRAGKRAVFSAAYGDFGLRGACLRCRGAVRSGRADAHGEETPAQGAVGF